MEKDVLESKKLQDLKIIAKAVGVAGISKYNKQDLIEEIISQVNINERNNSEEDYDESSSNDEKDLKDPLKVEGILDLHENGYGFLRSEGYDSGDDDIYVPPVQVRRFKLKTGDFVEGLSREKKDKEKFNALIYVNRVNGDTVENLRNRPDFENLTPIYPTERLTLERDSNNVSMRIMDLISPVGKGQRGLIVASPKTGKTTLLKNIANSIRKNYPDIHVIVLLIDERPEEVTDMKRSVLGADVVASTFDEMPQNHIRVAEIVIERAKRLVEHKKDVVILVDSITRLSRAYNVTSPYSGKTLSGGLDPLALNGPKRFFGAARNIEEGGSLTILATALIETGSRMDDVIFEEFKGTGNMEIKLDRNLSEQRVFPAIDLNKSGTRKDELLLTKEELSAINKIRRQLNSQENKDIADQIIKMIKNTKTNKEFVKSINDLHSL
ncbi:transcription termination factor Rho [Finegoldia magna]|uniref:Transcription termination factor Rho n=1 Tax=Finegoldia magna TaxID=1260 RepID=A0A133MUS1_FINMA|nr:transcription termination factor Rho [Finegoldia magna]EXF26723.1 transcription termination factor Rho [Finegoldia magna ALB8]KXA07787.1 transcription termination factor Rho [Finegoldia magna]MBS6928485.1 transcription termination factor Rho [Finegoldia magna]MDU1213248.1 transcription termination factor Rho [Finegoldia magna]MDU5743335.1 transcription termination factor Rho [Finegoldia magna]